jgi:hypothetical protein
VRDGKHLEKRTLRLGVHGPSRTQVLDGIKPGETIVIDGAGAPPDKTAEPKSAPAVTSKAAPG